MSTFLEQAFSQLSGDLFEEVPVGVEEFVHSPDYAGIKELSVHQLELVSRMSQIYKRETLYDIMPPDAAEKRWKQTTREIIMQLGKGCVTLDTDVFDGQTGRWQPMSELLFSPSGQSVGANGAVLAPEYRTEAFSEGNADVYEVKTRTGIVIKVSGEHHFMTKGGLKKLNDLNVGDHIARAAKLPVAEPQKCDTNEIKLLGHWLSGPTVQMPDDDQALVMAFSVQENANAIEEYRALCAALGETPEEHLSVSGKTHFFQHILNGPITKIVQKNGLYGATNHTKFIPEAVFTATEAQIAEFVARFIGVRGLHISWRSSGGPQPIITPQSGSYRLARDFQRLLTRLGVVGRLFTRDVTQRIGSWVKEYPVQHNVMISDREGCIRLFSQIKALDSPLYAEYLELARARPSGRSPYEGDLFWDKIVSITPAGTEEVFTITATDTHNYVANLLVNGNSGKDFTSTVAVSYVVYLLLCLKSPAEYYGKPEGDSIDIINIAINADQANRVFFKNFAQRIKNNPWFEGKFSEKAGVIEFSKNVFVYSGHSEREAFEGYNTLIVILDEISGFALESSSDNQNAKTAPALYEMYKASVISRFAEYGKLVLLSFPRFEDDFIQRKYKDAVYGVAAEEGGARPMLGDIEVVKRTATLKVDPELPDGIEGNEFEVSWDEDHIIRYAYPYTFALRRPSWEVNPGKDLQRDYALSFYINPREALGRFACMPSGSKNTFFRRDMVEAAFCSGNGVDEEGVFHPNFKPDPDKMYYIHVDLAQKKDYCAVSMAHVEQWVEYPIGSSELVEHMPLLKVDFVRWWTPTKEKSIDFKEIIEFIKSVRRKGFNLGLVTFDRWNSHDTMLALDRAAIETEVLSVNKKHYDDFMIVMYDRRLIGPNEALLIKELTELRQVLRGSTLVIDHPRTGYKDLSDAVCGAIWNAIAYTQRDDQQEADAMTLKDLQQMVRELDAEQEEEKQEREERAGTVIHPPKASIKDAPQSVQDMLAELASIV